MQFSSTGIKFFTSVFNRLEPRIIKFYYFLKFREICATRDGQKVIISTTFFLAMATLLLFQHIGYVSEDNYCTLYASYNVSLNYLFFSHISTSYQKDNSVVAGCMLFISNKISHDKILT